MQLVAATFYLFTDQELQLGDSGRCGGYDTEIKFVSDSCGSLVMKDSCS